MIKRYIPGTVPAHVAHFYGSARAFKAAKRRQLKMALRELADLRNGCAYFPCGSGPLEAAFTRLEEIRLHISEKSWGR